MRSPLFACLFLTLASPGVAQEGSGGPDVFPARAAPVGAVLQAGEQLEALGVRLDDLARPPVYEGEPLTLDRALDEALDRNPQLVALRAQVDVARQRPAQARFLAPPMLETQIWGWPVNTLNPTNTTMYMFMVGQELPGRGKRAAREAVALKGIELATADVAVRARAIVDEIKQAYAELFLTRKAIEISIRNLRLLRQFADVSEAKYATGRISQQDVLKAVLEISTLHDELIGLHEARRLAEARLNTLLDRPPEAPVGPMRNPALPVELPSATRLQQMALERQPELHAARLAIGEAEAELKMTELDLKPDYVVQGGYMLMPDGTDAWSARFGISWPDAPWSRDRINARVAEARAEVEAGKARLAAAESGVRLAVLQAAVRYVAARQRAALLQSTIVPQSEQTLEVARAAYQTDRVDFLALIDDQRALLAAELGYYQALSDAERALADLERAVGVDLTGLPAVATSAASPEPEPAREPPAIKETSETNRTDVPGTRNEGANDEQ